MNVSENTSVGSSDEHEVHTAAFSPKYDIFPIVLAAGITVTNSFAIGLVWRHHRLQTVTNAVLASLAFSDLLTGILGTPLYLTCSSTYEPQSCMASTFFMKFISVSTVLHLLLATVDRYIAIQHSIRYTTLVTARVARVALAAVWGISCLASLVRLGWTNFNTDVTKDGEDEEIRKERIYSIISLVIFTVIPVLTMVYSYARIFIVVHRTRKNIIKVHIPFDQRRRLSAERKHLRAERKTVVVFTSMVLCFIVCWVPYFILSIQHELGNTFFELPEWVEYTFFIYPRFLTSLLNPLFYMFGKLDFKDVLKRQCGNFKLFYCCRKVKSNGEWNTTKSHVGSRDCQPTTETKNH